MGHCGGLSGSVHVGVSVLVWPSEVLVNLGVLGCGVTGWPRLRRQLRHPEAARRCAGSLGIERCMVLGLIKHLHYTTTRPTHLIGFRTQALIGMVRRTP